MRKAFSIVLVLVVMLSSVHFTIATHFCGGKVAAVKAGIEGTTASCNMEKNEKDCPSDLNINSAGCCKNSSHVLSVDNYKASSLLEIQKISLTLLQVFLIPVFNSLPNQPLQSFSFTNDGFHQPLMSLPGRLAFICVFRK
jgi:hypothetical protein